MTDQSYGNVAPLHVLGTKVPEGVTTAQGALEATGLANWNVRAQKVRTSSNVTVPDKFALVRDVPGEDKPKYLSMVGTRYHVVQNEDHVEFLQALLDMSGATPDVTGTARKDRVVFMSFNMPNYLNVGGEDPVDLKITAFNSFDGTTPFLVAIDPVRVFCANQLNYFRKNSHRKIILRHTSGISGKVQLARETLDITFKGIEQFQQEAETLISKPITDPLFQEIVEDIFPRPEKNKSSAYDDMREKINEIFYSSKTTENVRGTAWGAFNAVDEYLDHYGSGTPEKRAERIITSPRIENLKTKAFEAFAAV